ncbi:hypothetical protein R3P38DRAFT_3269427 [Favolaschia claudopus]|uniref:Uncharacterized protein n=1 Tax=Favolaschia claudopus TaxID=2862362 RepID=A0AAW0BIU2_9AGAR
MKLARVSDTKRWMKGKGGIFVEKMVRELVALKVTPENVDPVIHTVGTGLGLQVQDHISARQVGRVMEEGGIASDVQVAMEINASKEGLVGTYNASPLGRANPIDVDEFITFIKALGTDHANDQKKLARLITEWVRNSRTVMLGKRWLSSASMQQYMPTILQFSNDKIANAGGLDAWNALSEGEKAIRDIEVCRALYCHFGEQEWKNLSAEERFEAELLGGVEGMKLFWESIGGPAPVKLMNKANASAVKNSNSGSAASEKALDASEGGAVKLTSLLGALFNHKDDKRGQQDTFKLYFEDVLGFKVSCPDTSNTRFQSHCDCAIFIIRYLPQILQFMSHIMYNKGKTALNHLEANVLKGLQDIPTLTELVVLALYANAVSYAYMRVVRATGNRKMNALDLAEFHKKVISFCEKIAENPDLLLAPDASYETGTLDGQVWEHPEVFYAIQQLKSKLPNLSGCLKSFFCWGGRHLETFRLSAAARALIYVNPTNDRNEVFTTRNQNIPSMTPDNFFKVRLSLKLFERGYEISIRDEDQEVVARTRLLIDDFFRRASQTAELSDASSDTDATNQEADVAQFKQGSARRVPKSRIPPANGENQWIFGSPLQYGDSRSYEDSHGGNNPIYRALDPRLREFLHSQFPDEYLTYEDTIMIEIFQCVYIAYQSKDDWTNAEDILRCNSNWYNSGPRYDCVLFNSDQPGVACARLRSLVRCQLPSGRVVDLAVVQNMKPNKWRPKTSWDGCVVFEEEVDLTFLLMDFVIRGALLAHAQGPSNSRRNFHYLVDVVDGDMFLRVLNAIGHVCN